jgi:hypothetical protein
MNDKITIVGKVEAISELAEFPSGFTKRILVINTGGEYPQMIPVEFVKDKVELLSSLVKGQDVTAYVNLRGNEFNGKYYANIQGWKLEKNQSQTSTGFEHKTTAAGGVAVDVNDQSPF